MAQRAEEKKEEKEQQRAQEKEEDPPSEERFKLLQDFRAQLKVGMLKSINDTKRKYDAKSGGSSRLKEDWMKANFCYVIVTDNAGIDPPVLKKEMLF